MKRREKNEIDVIASLTPFSLRRSLLGVVTEWESSLEGHQVSQLDSLLSAPTASPRHSKGRKWCNTIPRCVASYSISSGRIAQRRRRIRIANWGKSEKVRNTCYFYFSRSNTRSGLLKRIHAQTKNSIWRYGKGIDVVSISNLAIIIKYTDKRNFYYGRGGIGGGGRWGCHSVCQKQTARERREYVPLIWTVGPFSQHTVPREKS